MLSDPENSRNILFTYFSPDINDNLSSFAGPFIVENANNKKLKNKPSQCCCNRLNFQWIFKEFDLGSNMKGFFKKVLIGKKTEESVDDASLDQWPWTSVSCRILSLPSIFLLYR